MNIAVLIRERLNALGATAADAELVDELVTDLNDRFDDRRRAGHARACRQGLRAWFNFSPSVMPKPPPLRASFR